MLQKWIDDRKRRYYEFKAYFMRNNIRLRIESRKCKGLRIEEAIIELAVNQNGGVSLD
jgi:hypothetical protein